MAEFVTIHAQGSDYEDAVANACVKLKDICGQAAAQVVRREEGVDLVPLIDWVLDSADAVVSLGGQTVGIEAKFFLFGSDE